MEYLPDELIQEIVEASPEITTTLARTSKDFYERIGIFAKRSVRHIDNLKVLKPSNESWMITYKCMLDDRLMSQWGRSKTSYEKEEAFTLACALQDLEEMKRIFALGVDVNISLYIKKNGGNSFTPLEHAIITFNVNAVQFLLKYNSDFHICSILEQINRGFQGNGIMNYVLIMKEVLEHEMKTKNYHFVYARYLCTFHPVLMKVIMDTEMLIPYGTNTGFMGRCNLYPCNNLCEDLFYCNGTMVCESCK